MNVFYDPILPGGVIDIFWIKTYSHHVLIFDKTSTDIHLQPNQMICGALTFLKPSSVDVECIFAYARLVFSCIFIIHIEFF